VSDEPKPPPGTADEPAAPAEPRPDEDHDASPVQEGESPERVTVPEGVESTLPEDVPRIQLPRFEGPLDLLLYLIRREKIDIHDIPIAPITREYMEYLDLMRELNLDVAGEFMLMAATLIHIKSKMLVPVEPTEAEGEDFVDPREELMQRLLELQRYKDAAGLLHQQAQIRAAQWTRPDTVLPAFDDAGEEMLEAGLYDLIAAFKELLERRKSLLAHEIEAEGPSVDERMSELVMMIGEGESLEFLQLFASLETKAQMITTFLALLELVRLKRVRVYQRGMFGAIRVFRPVGPPAEGAPRRGRPAVGDVGERWTRRTTETRRRPGPPRRTRDSRAVPTSRRSRPRRVRRPRVTIQQSRPWKYRPLTTRSRTAPFSRPARCGPSWRRSSSPRPSP
jgi:segregation and condensation protein A